MDTPRPARRNGRGTRAYVISMLLAALLIAGCGAQPAPGTQGGAASVPVVSVPRAPSEAAPCTGKRCRKAASGEARGLLADCRKAGLSERGSYTCVGLSKVGQKAYTSCRVAGKPKLTCEARAVAAACDYRGAANLCLDARPVYVSCRTRSVPRPVCIEGNVEYEQCREHWGVTSRGDVCVKAVAVYEDCRRGSGVTRCEARLREYARTNR